jgi:hypothetical protein
MSLLSSWFEEDIPDWVYTTSENGWTSNRIGCGWLEHVFLPETEHEGRARLLLLDGHGSHVSIDFMWILKQNNVWPVWLPPHSSHVLQPLDLAGFSPTKSRYRAQIAALAALDDAAPVKKQRFLNAYHMARTESLNERVIRSGWKAAGLVPWNPSKALNSSQVIRQPTTPPHQVLEPDTEAIVALRTPLSERHLYIMSQQLQKTQNLNRDTRILLSKAGKALAQASSKQVEKEMVIKQLNAQLDVLKPQKPRKRVRGFHRETKITG